MLTDVRMTDFWSDFLIKCVLTMKLVIGPEEKLEDVLFPGVTLHKAGLGLHWKKKKKELFRSASMRR